MLQTSETFLSESISSLIHPFWPAIYPFYCLKFSLSSDLERNLLKTSSDHPYISSSGDTYHEAREESYQEYQEKLPVSKIY